MTCETCELFHVYFNVADELWGGLTLTDLDRDFVKQAQRAQRSYGLPWPPYLPAAEELQLDMQNGRYRGEHNPFNQRSHKMTWQELQDPIYEAYDKALNSEDVDIYGYDVVIDDVLGAPVASFEIDHDAQKIVLKTGANENYG